MKKKEYISCAIILATHNGEPYLAQQMKSFINQVGVKTKVYYSDDFSTDESRAILCDFNAVNLNEANAHYGGSAANFINAIKKYKINCKEDYIFLSDQDDVWLPNKMQSAIREMSQRECEAYSGSYYAWRMSSRKIKYINKSYKQNSIDYMFRSPGPGFTFGFTRDAFEKLQIELKKSDSKYDNVRWHDWLIYALARNLKIKWYIDPNPYALYRLHDTNDTGQANTLNEIRRRFKFIRDGSFGAQVRIMIGKRNDGKFIQAVKRMSLGDRIYLMRFIPQMRTKTVDRVALFLWLVLER